MKFPVLLKSVHGIIKLILTIANFYSTA